jgi:hypothetical protein
MWLLRDVGINEARKTWDGGREVPIHVVVNLVGRRAMKMITTASLLMIRDLESYDPKRIEVTKLCGADRVLSVTLGCRGVATVRYIT